MADNLFDLAARISVDNSGVDSGLTATQKKVLDLAKQFEATELVAKKSSVGMATSMAAVNAEIGKMKVSNLSADYDKFSNALKNNSVNSRKAADDFLNLFSKVQGHSTAAKEAESATHKVSEALRILGSSAVVAEGPMGGVSSRLRALSSDASEMTSLLGPAGLVVLGFAAAAAGAAALGVAIFELSKHAAAYGEEIYKAQASTGLSAQTLSTLKVVSAETGTSFDSLTMSAARMQVAISRAFTEKGGEATRALELLKLRNDEFKNSRPDEQFLKIAKALQEQTNQSDKNRAALALVSRGFNVSADALKEFAEHYDEATKKANAFGLMLSQEDVEAAHKFDVALKDLGLGVEGFGVQVGQKTMPMIEHAMEELARALGLNESSWQSWGQYVGEVLAKVVYSAEVASSLIANALAAAVKTPIATGKGILAGAATGFATGNWGLGFGMATDTAGGPTRQAGDNFRSTLDAANLALNNALLGPSASSRNRGGGAGMFPSGGSGRGGGGADPAAGAKKLADLRLKAVLDELKSEEDANKRSLARQWEDFDTYRTRYISTENRRHAAVIAGLKEEMDAAENIRKSQQKTIAIQEVRNKQAQEETTHKKNEAALNDQQAKLLDQLNDFMSQQVREIGYARSNTDQYDKAVLELEVALRKAGFAEVDRWHAMLMSNAATQRAIDLTKQLTRERRAISQRPRFAEDKNFAQSVGIELDTTDATRRRRAIFPSDAVLARLHELAGQITSTLDQSIHAGFDKGIKEGFRSMAIGFAQILEQMAEQWLASSIFRMLTSAFTPTGGQSSGGGLGGIFRTLLGIGAAGLTHSASLPTGTMGSGVGLIGLVPSHAAGLPFVPFDNYPALLHKGEAVIPASQNTGGGHTFVFNISSPNPQSFMNWETQSQITSRMKNALQRAGRS